MKFIRLRTTDPYYNLAVEEYLFSHTDDEVFMLWQNDPVVVVGRNQNVYAEVRTELLRKWGIRLARRITGGGAVYHDRGNLNYTYIARGGEEEIDFATFSAPIVEALGSLGVTATLSGRNDLLVNGKKISGNAQHRVGDRVLHHGTLLYDSDLSILSSVLRADPEKLSAKSIRSVSSRVMNLCEVLPLAGGVEELTQRILDCLVSRFDGQMAEPPENERIHALAVRNASEEWLYPNRAFLSQYTVTGKKRYPFGGVEIEAEMWGERIRRLQISGDFFGTEPVSVLEENLQGVSADEIPERLRCLPVERYIFGMTREALAELLQNTLWGREE